MRSILIITVFILACAIGPNQACHTYSIPDTDELTQGPYWMDEKLNRSDITSGQQGSPFTLTLQLINKTALAAACAATSTNESNVPLTDGTGVISGAQVDIWYANASGHYSDYQVEGTLGLTFLRGYQITNSSGYVTFQGPFPGWYTGRTTHIHIRVRLYSADGTNTYDDTTQLFFYDTFSDSVYAANSVYNHGTRNTYNTGDGIYQSVMLMNATGSLATGYSASMNIYYPFATVSGGSSNGGATGGGATGGSGPNGGGTSPSGGPSGAGTPPSATTSTPTTTATPTTATPTSAPTTASNATTASNTTTTAPTTSSPTSNSSSSGVKTPNHASHPMPASFLFILAAFLMIFQ